MRRRHGGPIQLRPRETFATLYWDLAWARGLIWVLAVGGGRIALLPATHLYLSNRYCELGRMYARHGLVRKAARLDDLAEWHYQQAWLGGPPDDGGARAASHAAAEADSHEDDARVIDLRAWASRPRAVLT